MYGFSTENTDLPYTSEHVGLEARIVKVWGDIDARYFYRLYKPYKSWFGANRWVVQYRTDCIDKAKRWADHYGIEIKEAL